MSPKRRITIAALILIGYTLMLLAVGAMGWYGANSMNQLKNITQNLYEHPFAVSNAASDMKGLLFQIRNQMLQIVLVSARETNTENLQASLNELDRQVQTDLGLVRASFLGDQLRVDELEGHLREWQAIRAEILQARNRGDFVAAENLVKKQGNAKFAEVLEPLEYVMSFALQMGQQLTQDAHQQSNQIVNRMIWLSVLLAIFVFCTAAVVCWRVQTLQRVLDDQATTDYLTGVPNRRHFMELAERELGASVRYGKPLSIAVVDLDMFKSINDRYGHQMGDLVLKRFCAECRQTLRDSDILARVGGEEFAILLPNTRLTEAQDVIDRVRKTIERAEVQTDQAAPLKFTASFGVAQYSSDREDISALLHLADQALYESKKTGRNRVSVWGDL
jgi:diguanylate cyclase (GGDEF)-like protein